MTRWCWTCGLAREQGVERAGNITRRHLPPYSPELNGVERRWQYLKSHFMSNRAFADLAVGKQAV